MASVGRARDVGERPFEREGALALRRAAGPPGACGWVKAQLLPLARATEVVTFHDPRRVPKKVEIPEEALPGWSQGPSLDTAPRALTSGGRHVSDRAQQCFSFASGAKGPHFGPALSLVSCHGHWGHLD